MSAEVGPEKMIHTPYDLGVGVEIGHRKQTDAWLCSVFQREHAELIMVFSLTDGPKPYLIVQFDQPEVVRTLDEHWISTEPHNEWEGDLSWFCRTVEGADYHTPLQWVRVFFPDAKLYQFVTGDTCVEVISKHPPKARLANKQQLPACSLATDAD